MPNEPTKPCPFSHIEKDYEHELSVVKQEDNHGLARVCCRCGYRSPVMGFDKESVIKAHNSLYTRPNQEDLAEAVELLKDFYRQARRGRSRAKGHNCYATAACQSIIDLYLDFLSKRQGGS